MRFVVTCSRSTGKELFIAGDFNNLCAKLWDLILESWLRQVTTSVLASLMFGSHPTQ